MLAGTIKIENIFSGSRLLEIPFFQRSYVWDVEQWERLLNDMEYITRYQTSHFLGSVILKYQTTSLTSKVGDIRLVIDGQQRLTTLAIFFKVISLLDSTQAKFFERHFKLEDDECVIKHNFYDTDVFNQIMSLKEPIEVPGNHKIIRSYNWFRNNINLEKLDINIIKNSILFVGIEISNDEEEQQIFETINSTGVKLTTGELLKNYFFNREDISMYEKTWKPIFENDSECISYWDEEVSAGRAKKSNLELFFFSLLQIKLQDKSLKVRTEDKNSLGRFDGLFNNYKSFINKYSISKTDFLNEIIEYAKIYKEHFDSQIIDQCLTSKYGIDRINAIIYGLENTTIIPYILYVLKNTSEIEEQTKIFKYIETYIIRRIICKCSNKNYNNLFSENLIGNEILTYNKLETYIKNLSEQNNSIPNDKDLFIGFENNILTNKQSLGVLYLLESAIRTDAFYSTALLGLSKYTLEHLMPKKWRNHWEPLHTEKENIERDHILQTLGNLAIITGSLNSSIRDAKWDIKLEGKSTKLGLKAYASGLQTMSDVLDKDIWNEECIRKRSLNLYKNAVSIWNIDDDSFDIDSYLNKVQENVILGNDNEFVTENIESIEEKSNRTDIDNTSETIGLNTEHVNDVSIINAKTVRNIIVIDNNTKQLKINIKQYGEDGEITNADFIRIKTTEINGYLKDSPQNIAIVIESHKTPSGNTTINVSYKNGNKCTFKNLKGLYNVVATYEGTNYTFGLVATTPGRCVEPKKIQPSRQYGCFIVNSKPQKMWLSDDDTSGFKARLIALLKQMGANFDDKIENEGNIAEYRHEEIIEKINFKLQSYYGDYIELNNNFTLKDIDRYIDNNPNNVGRFIINNIRFTLTRVRGVVENSDIKRPKRYYFIKENSDRLMYFDSITNARKKFKIN